MSRKGKQPISVPKNVEVQIRDGSITVKGPKGSQSLPLLEDIHVEVKEGEILVGLKRADDKKKNFHGLARSLIANMVKGCSEGFKKTLEMVGVGYRASVQGTNLDLQVGFSHPTMVAIPEGITVHVEKSTVITITGIDAQSVGQFAASVRAMRPPEPYQGKGIRYQNEYIRRKAGKTAAKK